ncbi:nucleoside deaminase [bacterium]|nr:nucleoside deaminase [bacterium]
MYQVISNEKINSIKLENARKIILDLQSQMQYYISKGHGPFLAAIYDEHFNLIAKAPNSVLRENCSNNHAEMNTIKLAEEKLGTNDLAPYNLSIYVTAEPCIMCLGAIMWSGIRSVYYGVPSSTVEKITGFDEGFKPNWLEEFKKRGITVYGNIEPIEGEKQLALYVENGNKVYKPSR